MNKARLFLLMSSLFLQTTLIAQDTIPESLKQLIEFRIEASNWKIQNKDEIVSTMKNAGKTVSRINDSWKRSVENTKKRTSYLFLAFKYENSKTISYNPWISIVVEKIAEYPSVTTGHDYLKYVISVLDKTGLYVNTSEISSARVSGKQFYFFETHKINKRDVTQRNYAFINGDFALNIVFSYSKKSELKELRKIINSFEFVNRF